MTICPINLALEITGFVKIFYKITMFTVHTYIQLVHTTSDVEMDAEAGSGYFFIEAEAEAEGVTGTGTGSSKKNWKRKRKQ